MPLIAQQHEVPTIAGDHRAKLWGKTAGAATGLSAATGIALHADRYVGLLPASPWAHVPLWAMSRATAWATSAVMRSAQAATTAVPGLAWGVYESAKVADILAALVGMAQNNSWRGQGTLILRAPFAAYPTEVFAPNAQPCNPVRFLPNCPDPSAYERAAKLAPVVFGVATISAGTLLGAMLFVNVWRLTSPLIATLPADLGNLLGPQFAGLGRDLVATAKQAERDLALVRAQAALAAAMRDEESGFGVNDAASDDSGSSVSFVSVGEELEENGAAAGLVPDHGAHAATPPANERTPLRPGASAQRALALRARL